MKYNLTCKYCVFLIGNSKKCHSAEMKLNHIPLIYKTRILIISGRNAVKLVTVIHHRVLPKFPPNWRTGDFYFVPNSHKKGPKFEQPIRLKAFLVLFLSCFSCLHLFFPVLSIRFTQMIKDFRSLHSSDSSFFIVLREIHNSMEKP